MDKEIKITRGSLVGMILSIIAVSLIIGIVIGLGKAERMSVKYGDLLDARDVLLQELVDERDSLLLKAEKSEIKICFPGDLDALSKAVLLMELSKLIVEDLEGEDETEDGLLYDGRIIDFSVPNSHQPGEEE